MDAGTAIALGREVLAQALTIIAPLLGISLLVGIVVALFQALTSLQEQTVAMVPKLLALAGALFFLMPWILHQLTDYALRTLHTLGQVGGGA
jgi:flagellar biosynthetic protein FliQ